MSNGRNRTQVRNDELAYQVSSFVEVSDIFLAALKLLKNPSTDRVVVVGDTPWDAQGRPRDWLECAICKTWWNSSGYRG